MLSYAEKKKIIRKEVKNVLDAINDGREPSANSWGYKDRKRLQELHGQLRFAAANGMPEEAAMYKELIEDYKEQNDKYFQYTKHDGLAQQYLTQHEAGMSILRSKDKEYTKKINKLRKDKK